MADGQADTKSQGMGGQVSSASLWLKASRPQGCLGGPLYPQSEDERETKCESLGFQGIVGGKVIDERKDQQKMHWHDS